MQAGDLRHKITFQTKSLKEDDIGQQSEVWTNFFTCFAAIEQISGDEFWIAKQQHAENTLKATVRYCTDIASIDTVFYRVVFGEKTYDIISIENELFQNSWVTFRIRQVD